ncbi:MAG: sulfatase, partial [Deltaproteobacteria bacterium]|jgi:arylsulfatase A-like enzyme|nr:sulfatase [Deltaproteobacteria bacterium]
VVVVLIDTLRADRLASYNPETRVRTDHLDRLAKEAVLFERCTTPENWTKPAIASLLSGLYPETHRTKGDRDTLPASVVMASEHFRELGFATAGFVANGYVSGKFGFEEGWGTWTNYVREGKRNRAQFVVDDAVAWLGRRPAGKPFFLYVHTIDPHVPYIPPKDYWREYDPAPYNGPVSPTQTAKLLEQVKTGKVKLNERDKIRLEALYDGEITYHDDHLARLYEALDRAGLLDDTLLVVTSDHGEEFFEHGSVGHGHSLYEELLHVPLYVRLPGAAAGQGIRVPHEVSLTDVLPTACEVAGVECPDGVEGRSLVPLLEGAVTDRWPSVGFSDFLVGQRAARMGRYKLIYRGLNPYLYDLETDPRETEDLREKLPVAYAALRDALGRHQRRFVGVVAEGKPVRKQAAHEAGKAVIDPETKKQLEKLGYMH